MPPARFERTTPGLGILCSIHLSYGGVFVVVFSVPLQLRLHSGKVHDMDIFCYRFLSRRVKSKVDFE